MLHRIFLPALLLAAVAPMATAQGTHAPLSMLVGAQRRQRPSFFEVPEVQRELGISPAQLAKLQALPRPQRGGPGGGRGGPGGPGGPPPGGPGGAGGPGGGAEREKMIRGILNPHQYGRYQQLRMQMEGARALERREVAKELGLSAAQEAKLETIVPRRGGGRGGPGGPGGPPPGGPGGPPGGPGGPGGGRGGRGGGGGRGRMTPEMRKEQMEKAMAILSPGQRSKWQKMLGKPFKFPEPPPRGGR